MEPEHTLPLSAFMHHHEAALGEAETLIARHDGHAGKVADHLVDGRLERHDYEGALHMDQVRRAVHALQDAGESDSE